MKRFLIGIFVLGAIAFSTSVGFATDGPNTVKVSDLQFGADALQVDDIVIGNVSLEVAPAVTNFYLFKAPAKAHLSSFLNRVLFKAHDPIQEYLTQKLEVPPDRQSVCNCNSLATSSGYSEKLNGMPTIRYLN